MMQILFRSFVVFVVLLSFHSRAQADRPEEPKKPVRLYSTLYEPTEHPDHARHHVPAPGWETFEHRTQLICLRGFHQTDNVGQDFEKTIDRFQQHGLGRIIWPSWNTIYFTNLDELVEIVKRRGLYLFDFWGYVPGSGEYKTGDDFWLQFRADPKQFRLLEETLGDRWLGMDNGEQDGRYIGGYAPAIYPISENRFDQYLHFQRHFQQLSEDLGDRLATLVSLNFGHYFMKEGVYTLIGAETAQALPNSQVYYSYIRGAGKQYGVLWFGNASIYNRWGWKSFESTGPDHGPDRGSSLSLLRRLLYSHILYNSAAVGFENGWFRGEELTALGQIQKSAGQWIERNGSPGVMISQVALLGDFFSGWSFPRHLYTGSTYRVWGNIPYGPGDYLNNNVLDMFYPGYQDSSYFHDETGFLTPTPYSDTVDCLLSDAPDWILERYPVIVVSDRLQGGEEIRDKLTRYVENGGRLVITAENLAVLPGGLFGMTTNGEPRRFDPESEIHVGNAIVKETAAFSLLPLNLPKNTAIVAECQSVPAVVEVAAGKGSLLVFASPFGLSDAPATKGAIPNAVDEKLANPFPMLEHVRTMLDREFRKTVLFDVGNDLASVVCRREKNVYTVGVFNNTLRERPYGIVSRIGQIDSVRELAVDPLDPKTVGYLPLGFEQSELGLNSKTTIAGGDLRIFEVRIKDESVEEISHRKPTAPRSGRFLPLRSMRPVKEEILSRPTFFEHFGGVVLDWKYIETRNEEAVAEEAKWIRLQKLRIAVDFSSGVNLFPDLRLIKNDATEYEKSMKRFRDVIAKAAILGARDIILTAHRVPENNYSPQQTREDTIDSFRQICRFAAKKGITVSLRVSVNQQPTNLADALSYLEAVGEKNLALAPHLSVLGGGGDVETVKQKCSFILAGTPLRDHAGNIWTVYGPLSKGNPDDIDTAALRKFPDIPIILDAVYESTDREYLDAKILEE